MKLRFLLLLLSTVTLLPHARAGIVYSGLANVPIPQDFEGVYLQIDSGMTATTLPADWDTAPWINPFFGGGGIATSPLLRPIFTGSHQILNLLPGTVVDGTSNFAPGENGSATHVGTGVGQFEIGGTGTIGFVFESVGNGTSYYGWMDMKIDNVGPGKIVSWSFNDAGGPIVAAPEPSTALFGLAILGAMAPRRSRSAR